MKSSRRISRRKQHRMSPNQRTSLRSCSVYNKRKDAKMPRRWRNFYFWLPFYLVFLLILASVWLGWVLHQGVSQKKQAVQVQAESVKGRSGGQAFSDVWGSLKKKTTPESSFAVWGNTQDGSFLVAAGDKSIPIEKLSPEPEAIPVSVSKPLWRINAVQIEDVDPDTPVIAVVIDDLGMNRRLTYEVLELPPPLTTSFLAYADDLDEQTSEAAEAGHELLVHTPMEPVKNNPGPGALKLGMDDDEIRQRLDVMLNAFTGYVGINNHMGSKFTTDPHSMEIVLDEIDRRGLLFLDSLTSKESAAKKIARRKKMPYAVRNVFLDNARDADKVMHQLQLLERVALKNKVAVGIGHPHQATITALKEWIPQAKEKGFVLVPISAAVARIQNKHKTEQSVFEALNHSENE